MMRTIQRLSLLVLGLTLVLGNASPMFAQDSGGDAGEEAPFCPLSHMIDLLEGVLDDPDGLGVDSLDLMIEHLEELCDGSFLGGIDLGDATANGIVSTRVYSLGPDGEMVEIDSETTTLDEFSFEGDLLDLDLDTLLDCGSIEDSIATLLEDLPPFDPSQMTGFDFDFGDCNFESFQIDLDDVDLTDFDLGGMISGGVAGGVTTRVMTIGPDGTVRHLDGTHFGGENGEEFDPASLGLPDCGSIDSILDLLDDLDLGGAGRVQTVVSSSAYRLGPDGEWIRVSGDGEGTPGLEAIIEQIEDALGGDE